MQQKISLRQLCIIIFITFSISKLYIMPAIVSGVAKESAPLSVLLSYLIDFLLLVVIVSIINSSDMTFSELIQELFGKFGAKVFFLVYAIYFLSRAFLPILEQKNSINLTFYESQPTLLTFMPFYLVAFYMILKGVTTFSRSMELMLPLFIGGVLITLSLSIPSGKYEELLPLFTTPNRIIDGTLSTATWFGDPISVLFLSEFLSEKKGLLKKTSLSFSLSALATLLIVVVFYAVFSDISERQYFAPLKMSKYSIALSNIGRLDYLGALIFSAVSVFSLVLPLMLTSICLDKVFNSKNKVIIPLVVCVLQGALTFAFQSDLFQIANFFTSKAWPFYLVLSYLVPLVILVLIKAKKLAYRAKKGGVNV